MAKISFEETMNNFARSTKWLAVLGLVVLSCSSLWSSVTYNYTGNSFDTWGTGFQCPSVCDVTASFTLAQPFAPNLPEGTAFSPLSASLTSGGVTVTLVGAINQTFQIGTDSAGNIQYWGILIFGPPNTARIVTQFSADPQFTFDNIRYVDGNGVRGPIAGKIDGNPGTWTATYNTPEPSGLLLFGSGFAGVAGLFRRRLRF